MSCKAQTGQPTGSKGVQACLKCLDGPLGGGSMSNSLLCRLSFVYDSAPVGPSTVKVGHGLRG